MIYIQPEASNTELKMYVLATRYQSLKEHKQQTILLKRWRGDCDCQGRYLHFNNYRKLLQIKNTKQVLCYRSITSAEGKKSAKDRPIAVYIEEWQSRNSTTFLSSFVLYSY